MGNRGFIDQFELFPAHAGVIRIASNGIPLDALFPAHAGVILRRCAMMRRYTTVPRTRGGDPTIFITRVCSIICSPHTRG